MENKENNATVAPMRGPNGGRMAAGGGAMGTRPRWVGMAMAGGGFPDQQQKCATHTDSDMVKLQLTARLGRCLEQCFAAKLVPGSVC